MGLLGTMKKNMIKIILAIIIIFCAIVLCLLNQFNHKGIIIAQWNNYYDENNIVFFYDESINEKVNYLNEKFKISDAVSGEKEELDKVLKICKIAGTAVDYDDIADANLNSGYDILREKEKNNSKKVSRKDFNIITRDMLASVGIKSRIGYFRTANSQFKEKTKYSVLEFWSNKAGKWIVIDCVDNGYFMYGDNRVSALEILNTGIRKISYLGNTSQKDYKNKLKRYLDSYTIDIDNTVNRNRSNSEVCYLKDEGALEIKWCNSYAPPTIFTQSAVLFEKSPFDNAVTKDEKAYLIVSLIEMKSEDNKSTDTGAIIAGFRDGRVMSEYYLNTNNSGYKKIDKYDKIKLEKGVTDIKLSIDGENEISSVTIKRDK